MSQEKRTCSIKDIETRIREKSESTRRNYLKQVEKARLQGKHNGLSCGNLAHGYAACDKSQKGSLLSGARRNYAIVSAYNDVLSAHHPYIDYPQQIQAALNAQGATAQFAGGVPAMCDGVTQGRPGMELSLFSRDVIAQSTAIALTHGLFDGVYCLGICDKIVPGLLIGALHFGHLPAVFIPSGPMPTGLSNDEKTRVRKSYAAGNASRDELLEAEVKSYHSPGTCTFYGTANTNQLLLEVMGLHLPGASFEPPNTEQRLALTRAAVHQMSDLCKRQIGIGELVCERALINAMVALAASGGSTNHTIHLVAIARAAGINIDWQDFSDISAITPLLARIYPNGSADVNQFHAAGGVPFLMRQLHERGLLLETPNILGERLESYFKTPSLDANKALAWKPVATTSGDQEILAEAKDAFDQEGGIRLLTGNIGRAIVKSSAVDKQYWITKAPARVFDLVADLRQALELNQIQEDTIIVLKYQGPKACGMPELHGLMPYLSNLLDKGIRVALVTDGRMSGASGRVPAAIHVTPEALDNPQLALIKDGDSLLLDIKSGALFLAEEDLASQSGRILKHPDLSEFDQGHGRALFRNFREKVSGAEEGACSW